MMDSLEKICLCYVARDASYFRTADFEALNVNVLQQLVSYLSAYQLNRLHDIFIKAGVEVQRAWRKHLALHWNSTFDFPVKIFSSDRSLWTGGDPRRVYLERLFQKIISNLDSGTDEPHYVSKLKWLPKCRHGICFQCSDSTPLDSNVLRSELLRYAENVRVLSVAATSPTVEYLLKDANLLKVLQCTVLRLDLQFVNVHNFALARELLRLFVQEGHVSEFFLLSGTLPSGHLEDLLRLVSGQQSQLRLGVLSDSAENRVADVVTECSLESEACASGERSSCWSAECSDDTRVTETSSRTGTDVTETSLQMSQDSVASFTDLADDDLYDVALTPSDSNSDCALIRADVPFVNSSSGTASKSAGRDALSHSFLSNNQSKCDHPGNTVSDSKALSVSCCASFSPSSVFPPRACTSFAFAHFRSVDGHLRAVLVRVLRNWTTLQKLAVLHVTDKSLSGPTFRRKSFDLVDFSRECDLFHPVEELPDGCERQQMEEDFENFIYRAIQRNQLTHTVLYETCLRADVLLDDVFQALRTKQNSRPLEEVTMMLSPQDKFTGYLSSNYSTEEFLGTACLDFSQSSVTDITVTEFVNAWIRGDRSLRFLYLPCFYDCDLLAKTLQVLASNRRIEELSLEDNMFDASCASCLLSILRSAASLRKLSLANCDLSKSLIDSESFVQAVAQHPTLTELNLQHNSLREVGCELLKAICLRKGFLFNSLDLSYNQIEGELLFRTCQEIQAKLKHQRVRFPLSELDLSGNIFRQNWRNRLVQTLMDCVDVFVARDPNLGNPAGPLADHISQM